MLLSQNFPLAALPRLWPLPCPPSTPPSPVDEKPQGLPPKGCTEETVPRAPHPPGPAEVELPSQPTRCAHWLE